MKRDEERTKWILDALQKPRTISELVGVTGIPESPVKRRVKRLEELGLVRHNTNGTYVALPAPIRSPRTVRPHLGFWEMRELGRQLERAKVLAKADILEATLHAIRRQDEEGFRFPNLIEALDRREREVYRRFGLTEPADSEGSD